MENNQQFEKISFWQLLAKKDNSENPIKRIEIPIIQRDYAQGRGKQDKIKFIRTNFLDALHKAIYTQSPIELDFVYGNESNSVFQPLDGQQRLTTLFLLHWYIAAKENKLDDIAKERLLIFTYETRTSSREFCNELITNSINFNILLESDMDDKEQNLKNALSKTIKNTAWFVASWRKDPTISAMLIMLDAIHAKFSETDNCWEKLTNNDNPPITFLYVKLENFGLSDDLYVKMNARGKQLTSFENFKSRFGKHIEQEGWEKDITNPANKFEHRIDTIWTDLFWKYKNSDKEIDNKLINFIAEIKIICYAENYKLTPLERMLITRGGSLPANHPEKKIATLAKNPNEISPDDFTKESFEYLVKCLNIYYKNEDKTISRTIPLWDYCDKSLFEDLILGAKTTFSRRLLFYAQTEYLLKNDFNQTMFDDWMRVVRNIVWNNDFDHADQTRFSGPIQLIKDLSEGSGNIYEYLSTNKINPDRAKEQIKQEIEKAKIIVANPSAKQVIHDTEDTNFCKGDIEFALYCVDYNIDNNPNPQNFDAEKLQEVKNAIEKHLNEKDVTNDFRRAFFTIGDNDFYNYWEGNLIALDKSEYKSKRCLISKIETSDKEKKLDLKTNFSNNNKKTEKYRNYLKELIVKLSKQSIDEIINRFISDPKFSTLPNWTQRIINDKELMKFSEKHYVAIPKDKSCCYLLKDSKIMDEDSLYDPWSDKVTRID